MTAARNSGRSGRLPALEKPDLYLLVHRWHFQLRAGASRPRSMPRCTFFRPTAAANHALLHSLAMANGGRYFNLANWKDAEVLAGIGRPARSFLSAAIEGGEAKKSLPAAAPALGRAVHARGQAQRRSGDGDRELRRSGPRGGQADLQGLCRADAVEGSLLRRLWAQKKLAHLMIHQKPNEKEIAALGKQFGMVTPYTSLLVLDSLEQYVQYEIAPPKSLAAHARGVHAADRHRGTPEAEAEGRQAGRGRPHVGGAGELVEQRVQVCQGFQVPRAEQIGRSRRRAGEFDR